MTRKHFVTLLLGWGLFLWAAHVLAQDFPAKPVTFILPFAAGGPSEPSIRRMLPHLEKAWGKPVVLDARPGAGGIIGTEFVVRAPPDGYTLLWTPASLTVLKLLFKDLRFDPIKDLAPVSLTLQVPGGLIVNTTVPAKTIEEFIAYAKANPGKLNYGSSGRTSIMLTVEAFKKATGTDIKEVPFTATAQLIASVLRNDLQLYEAPLDLALKSQADAGKVRPLLMIGDHRSRVFPDVPTSAEKGWNIRSNGWQGLLAPAGTPKAVIDLIAAEMARYAASPEAQAYAQSSGADVLSSTPEQFRQLIESDVKVWSDVASNIGLKPE
jgi:tripartite-type tricarboxylate transporter receptor subunit TctC